MLATPPPLLLMYACTSGMGASQDAHLQLAPSPCSNYACPSPLQVVHSRTFGTGAREGGVGVRMLLPVMDLLNHAGDEADFTLSDTVRRADNVRWVAFHATANLVQLVWLHGGKAALLCSTVPELPWPDRAHICRQNLKSKEIHHCLVAHAYHDRVRHSSRLIDE